MRTRLILLAILWPGMAAAQTTTGPTATEEPGDVALYCDNLEQIDEQREAENRGFDRIYASISTMTTASFCGYPDLSDQIDERIRKAIWAYDDRATSLNEEETTQLKQVKASYVLGRQMIDKRN